MAIHNEAQRKKVMMELERAKREGFTGYSVKLRKKIHVKPSEKIEVKTTRLRNGNDSIVVIGHTPHGKIPRILGQYKP